MRKLAIAATLLVSCILQAQETTDTPQYGFKKGNVFLEGQVSYQSGKAEDSGEGSGNEEKVTAYTIAPKAGYFFSDRFAAGVSVSVENMKSKATEVSDDPQQPSQTIDFEVNAVTASVFARYYFLKPAKRFNVYSEINAGFGLGKIEGTRDDETQKADQDLIVAGLNLGINYFVTQRIAISFALSNIIEYNSFKMAVPESNIVRKTNELNISLNVFDNFFTTPTFGLLYKL